MAGTPAIVARGLTRSYGAIRAVDGVDLEIPGGEVFALLGPNGAGKTTTVEIFEGYRRRDAGDVRVLGVDPARAGRGWRARIGIVPQATAIFEELTVREIVGHFASFYPDPIPTDRAIALAGLEAEAGRRCTALSGGQKRRVELALGIVGNPELLFLDEPTTGFDPEARRRAWDVVANLAGLGTTILLTTHYLDEAEYLAGRVGVIVAGRIVEVAPPGQLGGRQRALTRVTFRREGPLAGASPPDGLGAPVVNDTTVAIETTAPTAAVHRLIEWAGALGVDEIPGLAVTRPSLEDVYLSLLDRDEAEKPR
jgi:ABC-2 type transport system ATP-binding protein